jgi:(1->4)-alpha-D-glucan 1-alpha-D-glucosylmutase
VKTPSSPRHPSPIAHHPPTSTYRVQLNAGFTFEDARSVVPYLHDLGIGALYTSPFLCATPGSTHGYDVTDYGHLNPEIGADEDLQTLTTALRERGMGVLVDVVPNHMGIAGGANAWWQDVLENGRTSPYASSFDIDWRPLKEELRGKILLPVLGDHYGVVLERGELRLEFADGAFTVHYYETHLPLAPPTYPLILTMALELIASPSPGPTGEGGRGVRVGSEVRARLAEDDLHLLEFQSIITAFERLPPQDERDPDLIAERRREQVVAKRRLADLVADAPEVASAIDETVRFLNGESGDPDAQARGFDALDRLLDAQSYRLSSFRTAGEEINYRRFFAINELAAVRQEVPEVFAAAHALLMRLIASGAVTGLRIDHPDGLWDPAGYFRDLQRAAWLTLRDPLIPDPSPLGAGRREPAAQSGEPPLLTSTGRVPPGWRVGGLGERIDWNEIDPALADDWPGQADDGLELAERLPLYVVVEKILEPGEPLPNDWAVHGTVGYEFARVTTGLFVDPAQQRDFDHLYSRITGEGRRRPFSAAAYEAKGLMLRTALASETNVLARALNRISEQNRRTRDFTLSALRNALREVITAFPVYRTYITCDSLTPNPSPGPTGEGEPFPITLPPCHPATLPPVSDRDRRAIVRAVALAKRRNPASDPSVFDFLADVLLLREDAGNEGALSEQERDERCRFVMKFQQLTGPVMAKGVEDTAFYRYNRLVALNEVGGDPAAFGASVAEFHRENAERARRWPHGLLTSSTHDTKRSEDVRARIAVLSELPREWRAAVNRWARLNRRGKTRVEGASAPDRNDEYLFYQTVLGAWPWDAATPDEEFVARIEAFMLKAAREAQVHTSWVNPDPAYEEALQRFVRAALDTSRPNPFLEDLATLREIVAHAGVINALAQQLLKLTAPGVPDVYQGTELWDQSLVDPDNRRPVDYRQRERLLRGLQRRRPGRRLAADLLETKADGRVKLYLSSRALACRTADPDLFARGAYIPLAAEGAAADHVVAFARRDAANEFITVVPRLVVGLTGKELVDPIGPEIWGDTRLLLPDAEPGTRYRDLFTGETIKATASGGGPTLPIAGIFATLPFALLERTATS